VDRLPVSDLPKIVVIDDTPEVLDLLEILLSDEGFDVVRCQHASDALTTVVAHAPVLVIADLKMAGVERWELVDSLISDERTAHLPVIVCSGAVTELRSAGPRIQTHGGDVLVKPFDIQVLVSMVKRLIAASGG
jgi:CheY-like chemotaxis protein